MQVTSALCIVPVRENSNALGENDPDSITTMRFIWTPLADQVV